MNEKFEKLTNENFRRILDALDEGVHIVDQEGTTIFYNQKVSGIDGLKPQEVLGKNIFEAYPSLTIETSTLMQTLKTGEPIDSKQQTFINSRGEKITTINRTVPLRFENGELGAMEISRDITQIEELVKHISDLRSNLGEDKRKRKIKQGDRSANDNRFYRFKDIIGESSNFKDSLRDAMRAAGSDSSVLLYGETGTGKELFAQSIHSASKRADKPFVAQNCAALPKDLLEGLLFGTRKGGFTGATSRPGLFEQADGGTILLDEINAMDPALQAKLLRVLQENRVRRVGGQQEIEIDVRIIATMNIHPDRAFRENLLREDLFYRLNVVYIEIPPLRRRQEDIPLLIEHFIDYYNRKFSREITGVEQQLKTAFKNYNWPGNVRELQHVIESAFNLLQNEKVIGYRDLPGYIRERLHQEDKNNLVIDNDFDNGLPDLEGAVAGVEKELIDTALQKAEGNISGAARMLGISRQSLQYKIKKYDIDKENYRI